MTTAHLSIHYISYKIKNDYKKEIQFGCVICALKMAKIILKMDKDFLNMPKVFNLFLIFFKQRKEKKRQTTFCRN